jgi:hypothetical protein
MKTDKRLLDLGTEAEQIGTNKVIDSPSRFLIDNGGAQTFAGAKTFDTPAHGSIDPVVDNDLVPKVSLLNDTRELGRLFEETLTVGIEDLANGYISLTKAVAPGQEASLKILYYEGASAMTLGLDFTLAVDDVGDLRRLKWQGYPLGIPGCVVLGQEILVRYMYVPPEVERDSSRADPSEYWLLYEGTYLNEGTGTQPTLPRYLMPTFFNTYILEDYQSGKTMVFRNLVTGETKTLTLPSISGTVLFTIVRGIPIIYVPLAPESLEGGDVGNGFSVATVTHPYIKDKFNVYCSDWTQWTKVLELDPPSELTVNDDPDMYIESRYPPITNLGVSISNNPLNPFMAVGAFGDDFIGVYTTWGPILVTSEAYGTTDYDRPVTRRTRAHVRLYDKNFQYSGSKILTVGV